MTIKVDRATENLTIPGQLCGEMPLVALYANRRVER